MAQAKYITITTTGLTVVPVDWQQTPFDVSYTVELLAGATTSFTVQFTLEDVDDPLVTWIADPTNGTAKTATVVGAFTSASLTAPRIRGLRLNVGTLTGGNLRFAILQGSTIP